jgi:hypothetical protein
MIEPDVVYQQARATLDPLLKARGFQLASECHYPEAFGSAYAEYRRPGMRLRLTWDRKDRWLWMTHASQVDKAIPPDDMYRDLEASDAGALPSALMLRKGPVTDERIRQLVDRAVAFVDRALSGRGHR